MLVSIQQFQVSKEKLIILGVASFLAGFGFSSLKMSFPKDTSIVFEIIYLTVTASAVGFELCAILNSATCSVFGK